MKLPNNISTTTEAKKEENIEKIFTKDDIIPISKPSVDFEDEKKLRKYIKSIESIIRGSYEYRKFIKYLKEEQDYTSCAFFSDIDIKEIKNVGIEFHHYPFTLYDIVQIVLYKESNFYNNQVNTYDIANEVMRLHYEGMVGLVPLSVSLHQLAHSGNLFINFKLTSGNVKEFIERYKLFIDQSLLDNIEILEDLSERNSEQSNKFILHKTFQNIEMEERNVKEIVKEEIQTA